MNPILHVCDKCKRPILIYGRLTCKHVLCFNCATALQQSGGQCGRCHAKVHQVEQANLSCIFMCSHGGSKYGPDGCRRTYLSERDLQAHVDFRHSGKPPKQLSQQQTMSQQKSSQQQPAVSSVPSAEAIAAATAALVAENHHRKLRIPPPGSNNGSNPALPNFSQPPPTVMTQRSTNLITVPIQDSNSSSNATDFWTQNKVPLHQPPPNYYSQRPPQGTQSGAGPQGGGGGSSSYSQLPTGSYNEWSNNSRTGASGYHRR